MAVMTDRRFRRGHQVVGRPLGAPLPIAILDCRQVEDVIDGTQHLHELARGFAFVRRCFVPEDQDLVGQRHRLAGG